MIPGSVIIGPELLNTEPGIIMIPGSVTIGPEVLNLGKYIYLGYDLDLNFKNGAHDPKVENNDQAGFG